MKKFETCTTTINGREYTAQFNGTGAYVDGMDAIRLRDTGIQSYRLTQKYLLKNVLVDPANLDIDDLEPEEFEELIAFLQDIFRGKNDKYVNKTAEHAEQEDK